MQERLHCQGISTMRKQTSKLLPVRQSQTDRTILIIYGIQMGIYATIFIAPCFGEGATECITSRQHHSIVEDAGTIRLQIIRHINCHLVEKHSPPGSYIAGNSAVISTGLLNKLLVICILTLNTLQIYMNNLKKSVIFTSCQIICQSHKLHIIGCLCYMCRT